MQKFVYLPSIDILRGIKVNKETEFKFENELKESGQKIKQEFKNLRLTTHIETNKENKLIKSEVIIDCLEGDILILDDNYGYCVPPTQVGTVDEAMETLKAQESLIEKSQN